MPLLTGRETSFYGSPLTKGLVLLVSIGSFIYSILRSFHTTPNIWSKCLGSFALPTAGAWAMGVVLLYWTRPLERRLGSLKFLHIILSSWLLSVGFHASLILYHIQFISGAFVYCLLGLMATHFLYLVKGTIIYRCNYFSISSHIMLIILLLIIMLYSSTSIFALLSGAVGVIITRLLKPLPFPNFLLQQVVTLATKFTGDKPPNVLSGATIDVQRQQRMDLLEALVLNLQQRQVRLAGPYIPSEDQIQQLTIMGFRRDNAHQALASTQGDIARAIQLLTTNTVQQ